MLDEILDLFPVYCEEKIINADKEIQEFFEKRMIATYIPNQKICDNILEWQKYFINEVYARTGKKLQRNNKLICKLARYSNDFHKDRKKIEVKIKKKCECCNFDFSKGFDNKLSEYYDIMNPTTYPSNREINIPNIDHIEPISKLGSNNSKNVQTLCWICNSGKSDLCAQIDRYNLFSERVNIELLDKFNDFQLTYNRKKYYKGNEVEFMPKRLFYRVLNRDKKCRICGNVEELFTIMPIYKKSLYTYDNLITVCYECIEKDDTIKDIRWVSLKKDKL